MSANSSKPLKWFSIPQCFRYEKQQRGRLREHFQINCDIVGDDSLGADIETIALNIDLLRSFGLDENDFVVRISDREFWIDLLRKENIAEDRWDEILQAIDKSEREPREKTAEKLGSLGKSVFAILDGGGKSEKLERIVDGLRERGLDGFVKVDLGIVRGLAYYTGVVFEAFDRAGKFRALAGGGRYDKLIAQLSDGAVSMPAVGFAMGDVVLGELIAATPLRSSAPKPQTTQEQNIDDLRHCCERRTPWRCARADSGVARSQLPRRFFDDPRQSRQAISNGRTTRCTRRDSFRRRMARGRKLRILRPATRSRFRTTNSSRTRSKSGSAGCQPALAGSLPAFLPFRFAPRRCHRQAADDCRLCSLLLPDPIRTHLRDSSLRSE